MDSQPAIAPNGTNQPRYFYQVGGSLSCDDPCYVVRRADTELYQALRQGQFAYVFNSRQMGKSSLRVRVRHRLQQAGYCCAAIDLTQLGSQNLTSDQWYRGLISELWRTLGLMGRVDLRTWLREQADLSAVQQLSHFVESVILTHVPANLVIFIDEIDSVLSLDFSVDDFFAWIRYCYNQRAEQPEYRRLTFALFGVATPSDLIQDRSRTPFNIGCAIALTGFQLDEVKPLADGLTNIVPTPHLALKEILKWTGGQPFLTQKLCQCVVEHQRSLVRSQPLSCQATQAATHSKAQPPSPFLDQLVQEALAHHSDIAVQIDTLVQSRIISNWEMQDNPEHLRTIRHRLLHKTTHAHQLLDLYEQIWLQGEISTDQQPVQVELQLELMLAGLVEKRDGSLRLRNKIYRAVFNPDWIEQERKKLRALVTPDVTPVHQSAIAPLQPLCSPSASQLPLQLVPDSRSSYSSASFGTRDSLSQTVLQHINTLDSDAVEALAREIAQCAPEKAQAMLRGLMSR